MLLREVFSYGRIFIGVRIRDRLPYVVGKDASKPLVSWLKFETLGSNFNQEIRKAKLLVPIATTSKVSCIFIFVKDENSLFMKFTSFTFLEVVDKCFVFIYLMYENRFRKWFLIEKKKG